MRVEQSGNNRKPRKGKKDEKAGRYCPEMAPADTSEHACCNRIF
jgi:hypothetical protein